MTPRRIAATALLVSRFLASLFPIALAAPAIAAETDGEWKCTQAEDTGKWSCARSGISAAELAGPASTDAAAVAEQIAAGVTPTESPASSIPMEIDPYEARARAAAERIDQPAEVVAEPSSPEPVPVTTTGLVDEPAASTAEQSRVQEPIRAEEPAAEPAAEPATPPVAQTIAPSSSGDIPDYQALAYVPDKPTSLLELPPNFWVAQLMAVSSKEFLESYAEEHNLRGLSAARIASGDRLFFVLILGIYETKEKAQRAITNMPPPYRGYKPLLRTLGSLQDAMRKADQMTGSADF
jgi:septal ring-binding cell division protein DamX